MSATPSPADSPASVQPLHHPSQAALVVPPQAPLGNANTNGAAPGMGVKALLAKKMAKNHNPNFISPTDNLLTPCTQKLSAQKQKHFAKGGKPMGQLFSQPEAPADRSQEESLPEANTSGKTDDDENPF
ncbi:hypothetical protein FIBSPDRAFT_943867 [Athelia psychrophila]|uniref:Uncharacterized protein n=1 Tax=Athelia psychrophila TaxID=1759441 RepID=A0A166VN13_9AGAM|nr:hypothetical protein FIBSPDRAFT_943867 [Fibularhizoctonia sp. CBS 109695]